MTITKLNRSVLRRVFGGLRRVRNRVTAVDAAHMRRCIKAGLVLIDGAELVLTDAGELAVSP